jgi:hypothetical protein
MTTNNTLFNLTNICEQRKRWQLFPIPPTRVELEKNPYTTFTKPQLDMRRKAEILKYKSNQTNSQTNNLTKKQQYALIAKGYGQSISKMDASSNTCPLDNYIPTPSSASDVPGPPMLLYEDPAIPLYNYTVADRNNAYSMLQKNIIVPWSIIDFSNVMVAGNQTYNIDPFLPLSTIFIRQDSPKNFTTFNLKFPVGIFISGTTEYGSQLVPAITNMTFSFYIQSFNVAIYYNSNIINSTDTNIKPLYGLSNPTINSGIVNRYVTIDCSLNNQYINAIQYIGLVEVNNLILYTTPGFVYDIQPIFKIIVPPAINTYFQVINTEVICNLSPEKINQNTGCTLVTSPSTDYTTFSLVSE